ncbi:TRAP transporter substrate-binding protein [Candidatus Symbiobacter mobilis]|uniref:TRAP-type C4-dicarboxylate transporter periplasmic subunit n=1 Tax=Candidatus Symbiobacter mobilis CR TaxID=946483 RepID=U5N7I2_9BURK|nr:TRAP transporter substrate-binding protein [Candidatus Symbiobacter mobilis]AGX87275.1 TRAP-type C4-dicarboxylate transporter periplasmic subunit [Candidatus Symbiobacter mobilis CR]
MLPFSHIALRCAALLAFAYAATTLAAPNAAPAAPSRVPVIAPAIVLRVHHFLPATSATQTLILQPWCDAIEKDSGGRLRCQIYPSMQLGGTPAQLFDQVQDGIVDVAWTLPGYTAGRFPLVEAFELPFMMRDPVATSKALWDYVQQYAPAEFQGVRALALHVHGRGSIHTTQAPIHTMADLRGKKVRAPTRQTNRLLAALGATPVAMPVTAVSEALSKSVLDGALAPYDVVPSIKLQDLARFHADTDPAEPALYTATFILAMNPATYARLPPDLQKVIDAHSGQATSGAFGKTFFTADAAGYRLTAHNAHNVIGAAELQRWKQAAQPVCDAWVREVGAKGYDGRRLLEGARRLIAEHSKAAPAQ